MKHGDLRELAGLIEYHIRNPSSSPPLPANYDYERRPPDTVEWISWLAATRIWHLVVDDAEKVLPEDMEIDDRDLPHEVYEEYCEFEKRAWYARTSFLSSAPENVQSRLGLWIRQFV